jgi:peptide-methionine (S)-S-oxide reductase
VPFVTRLRGGPNGRLGGQQLGIEDVFKADTFSKQCLSIVSSSAKATLGGGCFWCLEAVYQEVDGVERVVSGYAGGDTPSPSYRQVCSGTTGHAEVVQVTYDSDVVSYRDLLEIFFTIHNPTTKDREGADVGPQYRSIILHHDDQQRKTATSLIEDLEANGVFGDPIVTEVEPLTTFYTAEEKHQNYYKNNPSLPYCQSVITPKVSKLRQKHADKLG